MKLIKKMVIFVGLLLAIPILVLVLFFSTGGIFGGCSERTISDVKSPDAEHFAFVLARDCGAATAVATHVVISLTTEAEAESSFVIENTKPIKVEWVDSSTLKILLDEKDENSIFKQEKKTSGIDIIYEVAD